MQLPKREIKKLIFGQEARDINLSGARQIRDAVASTYGPAGNDVRLGMPYGDPVFTRDGVTVAKRVILENKSEDDAAAVFRQASEKTNKTAGDGTTATIVFGVAVFENCMKSVAVAKSPTHEGMRLAKTLIEDARQVIAYLKEKSIDGKAKLLEVATVSAGDPNIGRLISDTLIDVGTEGGITIRERDYPTLDVERIQGYYFDRGFQPLQTKIKYSEPLIFVTQKQIENSSDVIPAIAYALKNNRPLIIIGDVRLNSDAMATIFANMEKAKNTFIAVVPPPQYGDEARPFLEDIATYVNAKIVLKGDTMQELVPIGKEGNGAPIFGPEAEKYFGTCEIFEVGPEQALIIKGKGDADAISTRAADIKKAIDDETGAHRKDQLEQRYAKLTGKIAIVNVGGSTPSEMEELRYRVEDAIEATKSAIADGVLPGGATMLVRASELEGLSSAFSQALRETFSRIMDNAAESADHRLEQVRESKFGYGFNLREMTAKPIDLTKAGIWDATRAVVQTIENGASAAATLVRNSTIIEPIERKENESQSN